METQTAIPKKEGAESFDQLRNLSCTNGLSKVMETIVLEKLTNEVQLKSNQYGGIRGSSTNHFLINMMDNILNALEDPANVVALMSIDFSKAFNRVDHRTCIDALAQAGASSHSLSMVSAFLRNRQMRFNVNNVLSSSRQVRGGSPQGTKLGNFLFVVTIDKIEERLRDLTPSIEDPSVITDELDEDDSLGLRFLAGRVGAVRRFNSGVEHTSTPHKTGEMNSVLRYGDNSGRDPTLDPTFDLVPSPPNEPWFDKYVDDVNAGEALQVSNASLKISDQRTVRSILAGGCQEAFERISSNAASIGMQVNPSKTQLLCVSGSSYCDTTCHIEINDEKIVSLPSMTLLGFPFGNRPNIDQHIA